uniref:Uncharacterized protein n=1 Tax=Paramoeba aestuarina TaxID=180227 RepID=A0A7S4N4R4_9EUKA|mmetsp:Transcript_10820/g.16310  ORF Transcript_10820/g.16310 Transcript_10820/m.16310 type:complete len:403 (+) Transcript_10820:28-1236(+)
MIFRTATGDLSDCRRRFLSVGISLTRNQERFLTLGKRRNPFLSNLEQTSRHGEPSIKSAPKSHPTFNRFPAPGLVDDLLSDDGNEDITKHGIHAWRSRSTQAAEAKLSQPENAVLPNSHLIDDFTKLRQLIDQGNASASHLLVEKLCKKSLRISDKLVNSVNDDSASRKVNVAVKNDVDKSADCYESHPMREKIQCLLMNTFYCIPDDTACEDTLRLEIEEKKTEWVDYRKKVSRIIHLEVVRWYLDADHESKKVSLVPSSESKMLRDLRGTPTKYPDPQIANPSAHKSRLLRTSTLKRPKFMQRNQKGRLSSPAVHQWDGKPTLAFLLQKEMEINLVVKGLRSIEDAVESTNVRFSVGVRGDSFPQDLSMKITMRLNEQLGIERCPISATFDLYFCVIYRP